MRWSAPSKVATAGLVAAWLCLLCGGCGGGGGAPAAIAGITQDELWTELFSPAPPRVVDIRSADEYGWAHIPRSENFPNGEGLVQQAGVGSAQAEPMVIVGKAQADAAAVARRVVAAGGQAVVLAGGMNAWSRGLDISVGYLKAWLSCADLPRLIDVRTPEEYADDHIEGAENLPLDELDEWAPTLDPDDDIVLICRSGRRSGIARDELAARGFQRPHNVLGGMLAWNEYTGDGGG